MSPSSLSSPALLLALVASSARSTIAQGAAADRAGTAAWSVEAPHGPTFDFRITLDEGTWMSVDVSPDGQSLVFDLLGDLYSVPSAGGAASRITHGAAYDAQPRFSPDGKTLAFVSDRDGGSAVWLADRSGRNPRRLSRDENASFASPEWTPDGAHVVVSRHDDLKASPAYELYMYPLATGVGARLVETEGSALGAEVSPDGRWVYFNRTDAESNPTIERYDRRSGETHPLVQGGGAVRPAASPDGRWLAFGRRLGAEERLVLRDLLTGAERLLEARLDWDQRDNPQSDVDQLPGFSFTPDSAAIVYSSHGKLRRHDIARDVSEVIPFRARFEQAIHQKLAVKGRVDDGPVRPRLLRWAHRSPDGKAWFFNAAARNYRYDPATRTVDRVGGGHAAFEYSPAVSPDGRWLAYATWSDRGAGHIYKTPTRGFDPVRLTTHAGHYEHLAWSADSRRLLFLKSSGGELRGEGNLEERNAKSILWLDVDEPGPGHVVRMVQPRGDRRQEMRPCFDGEGGRVYFTETPLRRQPTDLCSVRLDGSDKRCHLRFRYADDAMPSPDGKWVAFTEQFEVYLAPLPHGNAEPIEVRPAGGRLPVVQLSDGGGYFVSWTPDGKSVTWGWGPDLYEMPISDGRPGRARAVRTTVEFSEPRARARGRIVLSGARILTMGPGGTIERGDIFIEDHRIEAISETGRLPPPAGARIVDVSGKTIIPGIVDTHSHYRQGRNVEVFPQQDWGYVAQLAYGVTTIRDPSARSQAIFTQAEMVEMGRTLGPRIYSSGEPVYFLDTAFARPLRDLEDARTQIRRLKRLGATSVKQYIQPRREQRQWFVQAAREEGLPAIPEGAQKVFFDVTLLMDGYSTLEHAIKTAPLHRDIRALIAATGTYYVPTLIVGPGGSAEDYFHQQGDLLRDDKLLRFTPSAEIAEAGRGRRIRPEGGFFFRRLSESAARLFHEGANVALGAHGDLQGLGVHWELWAMAMGGLAPLDALRSATIGAAAALGLEQDIGSLETGKLADLVVLDEDPSQDIRNSNSVRYVMKNGMLWDAQTMNQLWPEAVEFPGFYWQRTGAR